MPLKYILGSFIDGNGVNVKQPSQAMIKLGWLLNILCDDTTKH